MTTSGRESILEIIAEIDKAISMEKNAKSFFAEVSKKVGSPTLKRILEWLTDFEASHVNKLAAKRDEYTSHSSIRGKIPHVEWDKEMSELSSAFESGKSRRTVLTILKASHAGKRKMYIFYQRKISRAQNPSL